MGFWNYIYRKGDPISSGNTFINGNIGSYDEQASKGNLIIASGESFSTQSTLSLFWHNLKDTLYLYVPTIMSWIDISNSDGTKHENQLEKTYLWGETLGTLSNQTDLQAALDNKSNATHLHEGVYSPVIHNHTASNITDFGEFATINDAPADNFIYVRQNNLWNTVESSGAIWGNIQGSISGQADIISELNNRASGVHTHLSSDITDTGNLLTANDASADSYFYARKDGAWVQIVESGTTWGSIIGDISNQTDLQESLNLKSGISHLHSGVYAEFAHNHILSNITDAGDMAAEDDVDNDNKEYVRKNKTWQEKDYSSEWGTISGNLYSQLDLGLYLNNISDSGHTHNTTEISGLGAFAAIDNPINDSLYARKNGDWATYNESGANWGSIQGDLYNQLDLGLSLNNISDSGHTHVASNIIDSGYFFTADDAPADGEEYVRQDSSWVSVIIPDSPSQDVVWMSKSGDFVAENGSGYFVDTTNYSVNVTLPSGVPGKSFYIIDYGLNFGASGCIIECGDSKIYGQSKNYIINVDKTYSELIYKNSSFGWEVFSEVASGTFYVEKFQGKNYGYTSGGYTGSLSDIIDKFSLSSDGNASDVGDLSVARYGCVGQSSSVHGYSAGGYTGIISNIVDKFSFSSDGNATDVGDLTASRYNNAGQSSSAYGYTAGGDVGGASNIVDKFSFSSDENATDVGDLTVSRWGSAGQSSSSYGYTSGGHTGAYSNVVDKFDFSSDGNATDVGDLTTARRECAGQSSLVYGYTSGGYAGSYSNIIDKFAFSSDENAADVGDLTAARRNCTSQSSSTYGYTTGGYPGNTSDIIDKFAFSSDGNATDVGDLSAARYASAGQQY